MNRCSVTRQIDGNFAKAVRNPASKNTLGRSFVKSTMMNSALIIDSRMRSVILSFVSTSSTRSALISHLDADSFIASSTQRVDDRLCL
jgi:hypothetical protein